VQRNGHGLGFRSLPFQNGPIVKLLISIYNLFRKYPFKIILIIPRSQKRSINTLWRTLCF